MTTERKKGFDTIYNQKILPFFEKEGFIRVSKRTKQLYKELDKGLSVHIYFEYKTFGSGFYGVNVAYYYDKIGKPFDDGIYLASPRIKSPKLKGNNADELLITVEIWIKEVKLNIINFIDQHSSHKAILNSNTLYFFSKEIEKKYRELLQIEES